MGGREYELICARLGGSPDDLCGAADIQRALTNYWMVTPDFSGGNGPFGGLLPSLVCPKHLSPGVASALATLYCALMIDQPSVIKRPVVEWPDGAVTVGFDAADWAGRLPR